jgi:tetratricopeptide (TPR) repeat protein
VILSAGRIPLVPFRNVKSAHAVPLILAQIFTAIPLVLGFVAQRRSGAIQPVSSLSDSLQRTGANIVEYMGAALMLRPYTPVYEFSPQNERWLAVAGFLFLGFVALLLLRFRKPWPALTPGLVWFLAAVAPVAGMFHVGISPRGDRFLYLSLAGFVPACVFSLLQGQRLRRGLAYAIVGLLSAIACYRSAHQVSLWKSNVDMLTHTIEVSGATSSVARLLGQALAAEGRHKEALQWYDQILSAAPEDEKTWLNAGESLFKEGHLGPAAHAFSRVLELRPDTAYAHAGLARCHASAAHLPQALHHYDQAIRNFPLSAEWHRERARIRLKAGDRSGALEDLRSERALIYGQY